MAGLQDVKMWCLSTSGYWVLGDEGIAELQRGSQKSRSGGWMGRGACCLGGEPVEMLLPTTVAYYHQLLGALCC